ncbi:MAG: hypothetical protein ACJ8AW_17565, partial [Rhodopila sp.]
MAGLVPAIHDFAAISTASRGWPGQARPDEMATAKPLVWLFYRQWGCRPGIHASSASAPTGMDCGPEAVLGHVSVTAMTDWIAYANYSEFWAPDVPKKRQDRDASAKLVQHRLRLPQVSGIKFFRKSTNDRPQQLSRPATLISLSQQGCERRGGAQFKQTRPLPAGRVQRSAQTFLHGFE